MTVSDSHAMESIAVLDKYQSQSTHLLSGNKFERNVVMQSSLLSSYQNHCHFYVEASFPLCFLMLPLPEISNIHSQYRCEPETNAAATDAIDAGCRSTEENIVINFLEANLLIHWPSNCQMQRPPPDARKQFGYASGRRTGMGHLQPSNEDTIQQRKEP